jgi:ribosomal protein S6--L-glutamate ligase|tara:strand:+ start:4992 stop:6371 length:1380 start_codon:yes stop_codon:yes gene_type:complete
MQVAPFKDYLTEGKKDFLRLLIITDEPEGAKEFHTADRLKEECDKLKYPFYLFKLTGGYTTYEDGIRRFHNKDDKKGFEVGAMTVAVIRGSVTRKDSWLDMVSILERANATLVNPRTTINMCADKYRTSLRLADYGLRQPQTKLINDPEKSNEIVAESGIKFPLIMKTLRGSKGVGVLFVDSEKGLDSIVQLIHKQDEDADLLVQEYIKTEYDVRVHVLGGKVLAAMKRPVIEGDFRSNVSQGSVPQNIKLTELEIEESLKAAKAVGGYWTAVDFIPSKDRVNKPPFFLEVNSSPGTEGIEDATKMNIAKEVIKHFAKSENRYSVPTECGFKEILTIKPFGELVSKFDTGNSGMPVIHSDKYKINGNKITWSLLGKTITSDIIRKEEIKVGGLRDYDETRYVVKLNVEFAGGFYEDVEFTIDDREDRTPILLDREFMKRLNVMVNPQRKYVITTKYSID